MKLERCTYFPFCWRNAAGTIERTFVTTRRFRVCEKHAKKLTKKHDDESWSGDDWSSQTYISDNN